MTVPDHLRACFNFSYLLWTSSSIPVLADDWIGEEVTDERIRIPEEYELDMDDEHQAVPINTSKKPKRREWKHHPMEHD
ncbi:uncharacterized protein BYT42DRAFT_616275 [Radiomyces spectabilis]|uniref:uncharacterized protein n=1 Tax=Radiomyces spectabilis TaxID=64574 RepID=UPI00221E8EC8|nr:uncharacterized protein BYT42DRAFT_616275 [Radiomyces spectabilis]KAI8373095.1 hypothetical protein BYT42DRAFT_616275 [Radiomyces spectabilis]